MTMAREVETTGQAATSLDLLLSLCSSLHENTQFIHDGVINVTVEVMSSG